MEVGVDIAKAVTRPPGLHVIVVPDERIDNGLEVGQLYNEDEHDSGQLSVAIEEPERDETDDVADEGEDDATDEVDHEGWIGENDRGWAGHGDFGSTTTGKIEK